jgi:hypothetical protein
MCQMLRINKCRRTIPKISNKTITITLILRNMETTLEIILCLHQSILKAPLRMKMEREVVIVKEAMEEVQ